MSKKSKIYQLKVAEPLKKFFWLIKILSNPINLQTSLYSEVDLRGVENTKGTPLLTSHV